MIKTTLVATALIQTVIGLFKILAPGLLYEANQDLAIATSQIYGLCLLVIAGVSVVVLMTYKTHANVMAGFITLFIFHLGLGTTQVFALTRGYGHFSFPVINYAFSIVFLFLFVKQYRQFM